MQPDQKKKKSVGKTLKIVESGDGEEGREVVIILKFGYPLSTMRRGNLNLKGCGPEDVEGGSQKITQFYGRY